MQVETAQLPASQLANCQHCSTQLTILLVRLADQVVYQSNQLPDTLDQPLSFQRLPQGNKYFKGTTARMAPVFLSKDFLKLGAYPLAGTFSGGAVLYILSVVIWPGRVCRPRNLLIHSSLSILSPFPLLATTVDLSGAQSNGNVQVDWCNSRWEEPDYGGWN